MKQQSKIINHNSFLKVSLCFMVILFLSCSNVIYHGTKKLVVTPSQFSLDFEEKTIPVAKDISLKAWLIKSQNPKRLLVQFHGNSENRSGHFLQFAWATRYNTDILIFDYRGFADSSGISGDRELKQDAKAVLHFIHHEMPHYDETVLVGQSIGGYYLIDALRSAEQKYDLLILDSTFSSLASLGMKKINSQTSIFSNKEKLTLPVKKTLIIHGKKDPVIPFELSKEIEQVIQGEKITWYPEEGKHLDTFFAHQMIYRKKLLSLFGLNDYTNSTHLMTENEKVLLEKKYCHSSDYQQTFQSQLENLANDVTKIKAPLECEESCLCNFYADVFKKLGSRRLSQSMYRQNSLNDSEREKKCQEKIQPLCLQK
jgi:pimeloyl-ACP methyl ester carboxylesterase